VAASLDYLGAVDREAIARAGRRAQALEALEFERARGAALRERLEAIVVELDGPAVDAVVFAQLTPEDVDVVRPELQPAEPERDEEEPEEDAASEQRAWLEEEIVRLQGEITASRLRERAFERYLDALGS
jgi:hypothetical protein